MAMVEAAKRIFHRDEFVGAKAPKGRVAAESVIVLPKGRSFKVLRKDLLVLTTPKAKKVA